MRYKSNTFLATAKRKSALIFQESILYEPTDTTLFRRSYFTGSSPASTEDCFNPQASIFMLAAYDIFGTFLEADLDTNTVAYNDPSKIFFNTFKSILNSIVGEKKGDALEAVGTSWLITRLVASSLNGETTVSARRLLGIGSADRDVCISDISTPNVLNDFLYHQSNRLPVISENAKEFANEFNKRVLLQVDQPLCRRTAI